MKGTIYLVNDGDSLTELNELQYDSEAVLQELLAKYPKLLAGEQLDSEVPRRWLLISREVPLASEEDEGSRWSVDHLFFDQDAIPTIVEVKRSSDTRIRREVVGQMLDYAANGVAYWPIERLRGFFEAECERRGESAEQVLGGFLEAGDPERFWELAGTNLKAGRVRLVFVADEIPSELRRILEFLNDQMERAEVVGLEVRQFAGEGIQTLVPQVVVRKEKAVRQGLEWDEKSFFADLERRRDEAEVLVARRILEWSKEKLPRFTWGHGVKDGSFIPALDHAGKSYWPLALWTYGRAEIQFQYLKVWPPFDSVRLRKELRLRLNAIPGVEIPSDRIEKRPSIQLSVLTEGSATEDFLRVMDWVIEMLVGQDD